MVISWVRFAPCAICLILRVICILQIAHGCCFFLLFSYKEKTLKVLKILDFFKFHGSIASIGVLFTLYLTEPRRSTNASCVCLEDITSRVYPP